MYVHLHTFAFLSIRLYSRAPCLHTHLCVYIRIYLRSCTRTDTQICRSVRVYTPASTGVQRIVYLACLESGSTLCPGSYANTL